MNWNPVIVVVAAFALMFFMKKTSEISPATARRHWKSGALLIDVRTPGEFNAGHLPNAVNIPLDEIEAAVPRRFTDKNQALLLHCASGRRSGIAREKLNQLGFANVFNLGSIDRARKIIQAAH